MKKTSWQFKAAVTLAALTFGAGPGYAALLAKSDINTPGGYPTWFQDQTGLALQGCLNDPPRVPNLCLLPDGVIEQPGFDPAAPKVFPDNFPIENFYFVAATAPITLTGGGSASVEFALEAAFNPDEIANPNQEMFHRLRILMNPATPAGTYTVVHPWGTSVITPALQEIPFGAGADGRSTVDVNIGAALGNPVSVPDNFAGVLGNNATFTISNFVTQTTPAPPIGFLGDCLTESPVTGGLNGNVVQILDPNGNLIGETNLFVTCGQKTGVEITPANADFGTWKLNAPSTVATFTVTNLTGADIPARDAAAVPPQGLILTPSTQEFSIPADTDTCAAGLTALAPGNTCTFNVIFTPTASSVSNGSISIASTGNPTATIPVTGIGDGVAPVVAITGISRFSQAPSQTISGTVSDNNAVGGVQVSVDGGASAAATVTGGTWSFNVTGLAENAPHTIVVSANDAALPAPGNLAEPVSDSITVDTIAPVVTATIAPTVAVTQPTTATVTPANPTLTFSATDTNLGTTIVVVDNAIVTPTPASPALLGPFADGNHTVVVRHADAANNRTTVTNTFTSDGTGPTIAISSPKLTVASPTLNAIGVSNPVLTFSETDAHANPATPPVVKLDGEIIPVQNGVTTLGSFITPGVQRTLTIEATDLLGNTSTTTQPFVLVLADGAMTTLGAAPPEIGDVLLALRVVAQLETVDPTSDTFKHGDVAPLAANGVPQPDGEITIGDVLLILRKVANLVSF